MILSSPPVWMWPATALAVLAYGLPALLGQRLARAQTRRWLCLAWVTHGLLLAGLLWGQPVRFGFAPALSITAWLVLSAYLVEGQFFPQLKSRWALGGLGALAVLLALAFPGTPLHASASVWLPIHLALGLSAYGLFGAAVIHAWMMASAEQHLRRAQDGDSGLPLLTLERLTFRLVWAGFVLLSASLVAGIVFSDTLYGASPRSGHGLWSHKTIFALLSWATFVGLLAGRKLWGWRGKRASRVLYIGAGLLLLSYAGSRFVLEVLLGRV